MNVLDIEKSNDKISELILKSDETPFFIARFGLGNETFFSYTYLTENGKVEKKYIEGLQTSGFYAKNDENLISKLEFFAKTYNEAIQNADALACFVAFGDSIIKVQNFYTQKYSIPLQIHSRSLEPFYHLLSSSSSPPWSHHLLGKRVLVVSPFVVSFQKQLENGFTIFKDEKKKIFLDGQEFVFYKSYQTIAGNHVHTDWIETLQIMREEIAGLKDDFDIALLSCGSYGLPLGSFIKGTLNKSAIYVGGGLQLLFGVFGKRWESNPLWKQIISENGTKFINPSDEEKCKNYAWVEGGCYW